MPRYTYRCDSCSAVYDVTHSMSEKLVLCNECSTESLIRVPSNFASPNTNNKQPAESQPGELVKEFIENAKEEIKTERNSKTKEMKI